MWHHLTSHYITLKYKWWTCQYVTQWYDEWYCWEWRAVSYGCISSQRSLENQIYVENIYKHMLKSTSHMRQLAFWVLIRGSLARNADTLGFSRCHNTQSLYFGMCHDTAQNGKDGDQKIWDFWCIKEQLSASVQCQSYSFIIWLRWFSTATCGTPINNHPPPPPPPEHVTCSTALN